MNKQEILNQINEALDKGLDFTMKSGQLNITPEGSTFVAWEMTDEEANALVSSICTNHGYQPLLPNPKYTVDGDEPDEIPNPITPVQFVMGIIETFGDNEIRKFENDMAAAKAALEKSNTTFAPKRVV